MYEIIYLVSSSVWLMENIVRPTLPSLLLHKKPLPGRLATTFVCFNRQANSLLSQLTPQALFIVCCVLVCRIVVCCTVLYCDMPRHMRCAVRVVLYHSVLLAVPLSYQTIPCAVVPCRVVFHSEWPPRRHVALSEPASGRRAGMCCFAGR